MAKFTAIYARTETRVLRLECEALTENEADNKFNDMVFGIERDDYLIDFDDMECVDAEDYIQDIEKIEG